MDISNEDTKFFLENWEHREKATVSINSVKIKHKNKLRQQFCLQCNI